MATMPASTPRMQVEKAVREAIDAYMGQSSTLVHRNGIVKMIVDRLGSAEYAQALRDFQNPPPHPFNQAIRSR